jgi:hypothetical protein
MEVTAAGIPSPNRLDSMAPPAPAANPLPAVAPPSTGAAQTVDRIAGTLQDLAGPQIAQLMNMLENARSTQDPMLLEGLLQSAIAAAHAHQIPAALKVITDMVTLSPELGPPIINDAMGLGLASIRHQVSNQMQHLTLRAKNDAEVTLLAASILIQTAPRTMMESAGMPAQDLLALAQRFFESGQYVNFVRATELGRMILKAYPAGTGLKAPAPSVNLRRVKAMWQRTPLLVLLLGWLVVGFIGGLISVTGRYSGQGPLAPGAVEIWATGFLALVLFQFFVTVRNFR